MAKRKKNPPYWEGEFYQIAHKPLDLSRMDPLEIAAYENSLLREHIVQDKINKDIQAAVDVVLEQKEQELIATIKKQLQRGKLTPTEIAEDLNVSLEMVLEIEKKLAK